jgi:hypothetical protein
VRSRRARLGRARARERGEVSNLEKGRASGAGEAPALEKMPRGRGGDRESNIGSRSTWGCSRRRGRRRRRSSLCRWRGNRRADDAEIGSGTCGRSTSGACGSTIGAGSTSPLGVIVTVGAVITPAASGINAVPALAAPINPPFVIIFASLTGFTGTWRCAINGRPFGRRNVILGFGLGLVIIAAFGGREPVMGKQEFLIPFGGTVFETNVIAKDRITDVFEGGQETAELINGASLETFLENPRKVGGGSTTEAKAKDDVVERSAKIVNIFARKVGDRKGFELADNTARRLRSA